MKRVLTIQDISCVGKCSLTAAIPVISALGVEACVLPTAVLSTHTGFSSPAITDLTGNIPDILNHWRRENFTFDAIYTGYLASIEQIQLVKEIFETFGQKAIKIVDPAMADDGKLYSGFDDQFVEAMTDLCKIADVIIPNLTEARLLAGEKTIGLDIEHTADHDLGQNADGVEQHDLYKDMLLKLADQIGGDHTIILTGARDNDLIGAMAYDTTAKRFYEQYAERTPRSYPGTGDLFASCIAGSLARGCNLEKSMEIAVNFTSISVRKTLEDSTSVGYGVNFEQAMPYLVLEAEKLP